MLSILSDVIFTATRKNPCYNNPECLKPHADRYIPTRSRTEKRVGKKFNPLSDLW